MWSEAEPGGRRGCCQAGRGNLGRIWMGPFMPRFTVGPEPWPGGELGRPGSPGQETSSSEPWRPHM